MFLNKEMPEHKLQCGEFSNSSSSSFGRQTYGASADLARNEKMTSIERRFRSPLIPARQTLSRF